VELWVITSISKVERITISINRRKKNKKNLIVLKFCKFEQNVLVFFFLLFPGVSQFGLSTFQASISERTMALSRRGSFNAPFVFSI
jgi:hypothetical protein